MSRQLSPAPAQPVFQQPFTPQTARQKSKAYTSGIVAGVEDVKYQSKYKELKRKVKEIETDNDKLHYKVLQAKRNIQRMKLERAILYERLSMVPPSPDLQPQHHLTGVPTNGPHGRAAPLDLATEHERARAEAAHDGFARIGRLVPTEEITMGPGVIPAHGAPPVGAEPFRQLHTLPALPPGPVTEHRNLSRSMSQQSHPSFPPHHEPGLATAYTPPSAHRSHSSYSPAPSQHPPRLSIPTHTAPSPHSHTAPSPTGSNRGPSRLHNHQRIGPGANINQAEWDRERAHREHRREEHERDWHREPERDRDVRHTRDREDRQREHELQQHRGISRIPTPPYAPSLRQQPSRDSPPPARVSSGGHRATNGPADLSGPNVRLPYAEGSRTPLDSRKRGRGDLEGDEDAISPSPSSRRMELDAGEGIGATVDGEDRGHKRTHQDGPGPESAAEPNFAAGSGTRSPAEKEEEKMALDAEEEAEA